MRDFDGNTQRSGHYSNRELLRLLWPLFRPHVPHFAGSFLLLVVKTLMAIAGPWLILRAIDVNIAHGDYEGLKTTVLWYLLLQIGYLIAIYAVRNWLEWTGQQIMATLRKQVFSHLLHLPMSFHDRNTPGELLSRVESDTQALRMLFTNTAVMLIGDILHFVGMFVVMFVVSARLASVTILILPVMLTITWIFQRKIHPIFVEVRKQNSRVSSRLTELLQAVPVLQSGQRQRWALRNFMDLNRAKFLRQIPGEKYIISWFNLLVMLQTMAFAAILGLGGYWALAGLVTVGTLVMFIGYVRQFFEPLLRLSEQLTTIQRAFASAERIFLLLREPLKIVDPEMPQPCPQLEREIRFENVWFRYNENGEWVLREISFTLPAGQHWALVGPTGSGKTTLVQLLLRFYEPERGRILIDGIDIRDIRQRDLRTLLGMVQQEIYLFPGSLRDNLTLGRESTDSELLELSKVTLADRVIQKIPDGLSAHLAERGVNLSLGQRQQLSFLRSLIGDPRLILLDEATSAIDPATEANLVIATRRLLRGRTALIIAHRLSTIRHCDQILVLQQGELIQQGRYEELIARPGLFQTLHQLQFAEWESPESSPTTAKRKKAIS